MNENIPFKTPQEIDKSSIILDIEDFIQKRTVSVPFVYSLLRARETKQLDITPTEEDFYFRRAFYYGYNLISMSKSNGKIIEWLKRLDQNLMNAGFNHIKKNAYSFPELGNYWEDMDLTKYAEKDLNCYPALDGNEALKIDVPLLEHFYIKTDRHYTEPFIVGEEAYAAVNVYSNRVSIYGEGDFSWGFDGNQSLCKRFALHLKLGAPVWNFQFPRQIHPDLKITEII